MKMEKAIKYLKRKGKIQTKNEETKEKNWEKQTKEILKKKGYKKEEIEQIQEVMKEGKIYGDPLVQLK